MKLIDILVQELPKLGGWPEGAVECVRFVDEATIDFYDEHGNWPDDCSLTYGPIAKAICITPTELCQRESVTLVEYEAALAASKPEWDGEGLPPVGCICEVKVCEGYEKCEIVFSHPKSGVAYIYLDEYEHGGKRPVDCISPIPAPLYFRPIRSEADKKRDDAAKGLIEYLDKETDIDNVFSIKDVIGFYDAIAAGKIPHIRID